MNPTRQSTKTTCMALNPPEGLHTALRLAFSILVPALLSTAGVAAQPGRPPSVDDELIVRLKPSSTIRFVGPTASSPPQVVARINAGQAPGGLGVGNPTRGRLVIRERPRGRMAEWIRHNPSLPEGKLHRSIVLTYPEGADIEMIKSILERNPNVERVGRNVLLQLHAAAGRKAGSVEAASPALATDEFEGTGNEFPGTRQWGVHALNIPASRNWTLGGAYLGIVDHGLETRHPDLRATHDVLGTTVFDGGAFRAHLSRDTLNNGTCSVDEIDPDDVSFDPTPGHGSHVVGLASATTGNSIGVAGSCATCSVMVAKVLPISGGFDVELASAAEGVDFLALRGAQSINMSFGTNRLIFSGVWECDVPDSDVDLLCNAMEIADRFDIVMVAASGNHRKQTSLPPDVDFPALDPRTIAVGGLEFAGLQLDPVIWVNEACANPSLGIQCGSWIGPSQDLMAPAAETLATSYTGHDHEENFGCGDSFFPASGYGLCTGTSMSCAFITGLTGLVRAVNPLLRKADVRDVLTSTASIPGTKDFELGHGIPDAVAAVKRTLGTVFGATLRNRLTPWFTFYSPPPAGAPLAQTHVATTVPQFGAALLLEDVRHFDTTGSTVSSYGAFPRFCTDAALPDCCPIGQACCVGQGTECVPKILVDASTKPRASVFIFTNYLPPTPSSPPLVPIYRLRYESALSESCESPPSDPISPVRDFAYATSVAGVETYLNGATLNGVFKYKLDGLEGFVYEHCDNGCPPGVVSLHRLYNPELHDTIVVPKSEVAAMKAQGYLAPPDADLPEIVGHAFANVDSDGDGLINGWERLIGSDVFDPDSDGDGITDGQELLSYDRSSPDPGSRGYGDPCSNGCPIFADGFESGDTSMW